MVIPFLRNDNDAHPRWGVAIKSPSSYRGIVSTSYTRRIIAIFFFSLPSYPASVKISYGTTFAYNVHCTRRDDF